MQEVRPSLAGARQVVGRAGVEAAWARLAGGIQPLVTGGDLVLLGVLLGGAVSLVQISSRLQGDFQMDACRVSRYGHGIRGGEVHWLAPPALSLAGRDVVVVDDIFEEGWTLDFVVRHCRELGARSVRTAVLVRKCHDRPVAPLAPDFVGVETGDEFLFGCGMDYQGRWRHLPAIWAIGG
jgi:hypoxanthine phosphoribosyltransferase